MPPAEPPRVRRPLTAVVLTLNEELRLGRCLDSLAGVADEILIVDSGSTDGTESVARARPGVRFERREWQGFAPARNAGAALASNDWIFVVDADEELSPELRAAVAVWKTENDGVFGAVRRLNQFRGKWIRRSGWYPDVKVRIYDRRLTRWEGGVHDGLADARDLPSRVLDGDLRHHGIEGFAALRAKNRRYAAQIAREKFDAGVRVTAFRPYGAAVAGFVKRYLIQLGFLDGVEGLLIAEIGAEAGWLRYSELRRLMRQSSRRRA